MLLPIRRDGLVRVSTLLPFDFCTCCYSVSWLGMSSHTQLDQGVKEAKGGSAEPL